MSLWSKPLRDITYQDVKDFCEQGIPEGTQLDYKQQIPNILQKTIAAFANTSGGLIIIGVKDGRNSRGGYDVVGFDKAPGIVEQITSKAHEGIYPSILPEISEPLEIPDSPEKCVVVVRVSQSIEAPHAITNGTKVHLRAGNITGSADLDKPADTDAIERLFKRRKKAEIRRERLINDFLERSIKLSPTSPKTFFWCGVVPYFPEHPIFSESECHEKLYGRRVAGGSIQNIENAYHNHKVLNLGIYGEFFVSNNLSCYESQDTPIPIDNIFFTIRDCIEKASVHLGNTTNSERLYNSICPYKISCGVQGANNSKFKYGDYSSTDLAPLDKNVLCEVNFRWNELGLSSLQSQTEIPNVIKPLLVQLAHGLGFACSASNWP